MEQTSEKQAQNLYSFESSDPYLEQIKQRIAGREPYTATRVDGAFSLLCLALAYYVQRVMLTGGAWQGFGVLLFTVLYAALVLGYAGLQKLKPPKTSWYWLALLEVLGLCCWLYPAGSLAGYRGLMLTALALYWAGNVFGVSLEKRTGNYLALDALNLGLLVPFSNLSLAPRSLGGLGPRAGKEKKAGARRRALSVLLGAALFFPVLFFVLPLLLQADSGGFQNLFADLFLNLRLFFARWQLPSFLGWCAIFLLWLYLCGLIAGSAHRRHTGRVDLKKTQQRLPLLRRLPGSTIAVLLGCMTGLYLVFIACQLPYYFTAFGGALPSGTLNHADFARAGFFELCRIAGINMALLVCANSTSITQRVESRILRGLNIALSGVTLLLLATAFSKMWLYMATYGLTPKRILTSVFMLWMAAVWVGVIVLQLRHFSIVRLAAVLGSAMFCALCLSNMDGWVDRYNARHYIAGDIPVFETVLLQQPGLGSAQAALDVATATEDEALRANIYAGLGWRVSEAEGRAGTSRQTLVDREILGMGLDKEELWAMADAIREEL